MRYKRDGRRRGGCVVQRIFKQVDSNALQLLVTANVVYSLLILFTLMMEAIISSVTSVHTRATRRNIPGDGIIHSHRREYFNSYIALTG
jgi:hypothetical protein